MDYKILGNVLYNTTSANNEASGGNPNMLFILLLLIVPIGLFFYAKKKKKDKENTFNKNRHEDDEVWQTIKKFLKNNNETGKEIIETYVAKRIDENIIDKSLSKEERKKRKEEIKNKKKEIKKRNKELKSKGEIPPQHKVRDLYVVMFKTRDSKTKVEDNPRVIECEVKMIKKNKHETERKIITLGERDYNIESKWILPLKEEEEQKLKKEIEKKEKKLKKKKQKNKKTKDTKK